MALRGISFQDYSKILRRKHETNMLREAIRNNWRESVNRARKQEQLNRIRTNSEQQNYNTNKRNKAYQAYKREQATPTRVTTRRPPELAEVLSQANKSNQRSTNALRNVQNQISRLKPQPTQPTSLKNLPTDISERIVKQLGKTVGGSFNAVSLSGVNKGFRGIVTPNNTRLARIHTQISAALSTLQKRRVLVAEGVLLLSTISRTHGLINRQRDAIEELDDKFQSEMAKLLKANNPANISNMRKHLKNVEDHVRSLLSHPTMYNHAELSAGLGQILVRTLQQASNLNRNEGR